MKKNERKIKKSVLLTRELGKIDEQTCGEHRKERATQNLILPISVFSFWFMLLKKQKLTKKNQSIVLIKIRRKNGQY